MIIKYCALLVAGIVALLHRSSAFVLDEPNGLCLQMRQKQICEPIETPDDLLLLEALPQLPCNYKTLALSCFERNRLNDLVNFLAINKNYVLAESIFKVTVELRDGQQLEALTRSLLEKELLFSTFVGYAKNATKADLCFIEQVWDNLRYKNLIDKRLILIARSWACEDGEPLKQLLERPLSELMRFDLGDMASVLTLTGPFSLARQFNRD